MNFFNLFIIIIINLSCIFHSLERIENKPEPAKDSGKEKLKAYWIGHATLLLKIHDRWILTDPNWATWLGPIKRYVEPGMEVENLPNIDIILISHSHLDHLNFQTLNKINKSARIFLPEGSPAMGCTKFKESIYVKPNDIYVRDDIKITAVPAQHFGGRWLINNFWDGEPYTGYVVEYKGNSFYFAGDTGYNSKDFKEIGKRFSLDLAIIPVGPYRGIRFPFSRSGSNPVHVNPKEAVEIFKDVKAKWMIPMHYNTFYVHDESENNHLKLAIEESGVKEKIFVLKQGESFSFIE